MIAVIVILAVLYIIKTNKSPYTRQENKEMKRKRAWTNLKPGLNISTIYLIQALSHI